MKSLKVLIGLSGGVDSAVAAFDLLRQQYDVEGCTMLMFDNEQYNNEIVEKSQIIAQKLNIKHHILDAREEFKKTVIFNFISEYRLGRTPNPCVVCNKHIKFGLFLKYAKSLGFNYISTGHYAEVFYDKFNGEYLLKKAHFEEKDQSYFLYNLNQEILSQVVFTLSRYQKSEIKQIAEDHNLVLKIQKESQDICFIQDNNYISFLEDHDVNSFDQFKPANFVDQFGNVLGNHKGIYRYTIGQRKKLGVSFNKKMFVTDINFVDNTVILSDKEPFQCELIAKDVNIISPKTFELELKTNNMFDVKIRYKHKAKPARLEINRKTNEVLVVFNEPQKAVTRGQSVVFYRGDVVIGGGTIK